METPVAASKIPLEASKERLTKAFRHLQSVVDGKLKLIQEQQKKLQHLCVLEEQNIQLKEKVAQLSQECDSLKQTSAMALTQLNQSITRLETLMGGNKSEKCQ